MKRDKQNVKLIVQPLYSMIIQLIQFLTLTVILFVPYIFGWETTQEQLIWKIAYYGVFSLLALMSAYLFLKITQIAIISETGIILKNIFGNIACIEWEMIVGITIEKLVTYDTRGSIHLNWIVIRTDSSQTPNKFAKNKRNIAPWHIIANKKNIAIMEESLKFYRPDLRIKTAKDYKSK